MENCGPYAAAVPIHEMIYVVYDGLIASVNDRVVIRAYITNVVIWRHWIHIGEIYPSITNGYGLRAII